MNLYQEANKAGQNAVAEDGRWLMGVPGIVAKNDDPERQHRVQVVIPSIDENYAYDEWVRPFVHCLGNALGSGFVPPIGSEVVLFGLLGQKFNLFYASVYNEELLMPEEFPDENNVGYKVPGNFSIIAALLAKIHAQNIELIALQKVKVLAETFEVATDETQIDSNQVSIDGGTISINSDGSLSIQGGNVAISGNSVTIEGRPVNKTGPPI